MHTRNLFDAEAVGDPYPYYRWLRDHDGPWYSRELDAWLVSRYDDVAAAFRAHDELSSAPPGGSPAGARFLLGSDPPEHTQLRRAVSGFFSPAAIRTMEQRVRQVAGALVDDLVAASAVGRADFMHLVADPLPVIVIAELLGIPPARRDDFKRWSDATIGGVGMNPRRLAEAALEMNAYFAEVIEERAARPGTDLISRLVTGDADMTRRELQMFCGLLLIAGNETTTNLIGNMVLALLEHPDQGELLRADRGRLGAAVEETMRYDAPVQGVWRLTTRECAVGGVPVPAGARLLLLQGAANRDDRHFPRADQFDLTRDARDHVGFGVGIHFCLGTYLARLEARIVVELLLDRTRDLRLAGPLVRIAPEADRRTGASGRPRVRRHPVVRGLRSMPVDLIPTSPAATLGVPRHPAPAG